MLHRIRSRLVGGAHDAHQPGAGLLGEYGIVFVQGTKPGARGLAVLLAEEDPRLSGTAASSSAISTASSGALDERIANYDARVKAACATDERCPASAR